MFKKLLNNSISPVRRRQSFTFNALLVLCAGFLLVGGSTAQTPTENIKQVNFRYSQNPKIKAKPVDNSAKQANSVSAANQNDNFASRSVASKTLEIAKRAKVAAASPTEIYKVDSGDVLLISLQNVPGKATNYFTVLSDGTIDYPLAGEMVAVQGLTAEEIEDTLKEKIKLYENLEISVKVREFASHKYTVLGLVDKAGEKSLQREAVPLYVVKAESITQPQAVVAVIKRANAETENINLKDSKSDDILIFPGDLIEFKAGDGGKVNAQVPQFYYIGGEVNSVGQKDFHPGITLTQAILASGGLKKAAVKKIIIRRTNQEGLLSSLEFDLNSIKNGNQPDAVLQAGDTIEIGN